jgi:cell division protein FtsA
MKRTKIAAMDVGTTKVCTVMADLDENSVPRILGVGVAPTQGLQNGMVVNFNEAKQSIIESVRRAEQTAGHKLESVYVGVTGRHVNSVNNRGVIAITRNDKMVHTKDLERVLEVAKSVKIPNDRELLHVIPRNYVVDGQEGVKNPVGMHGFRLDVEAHIITAAVSSIQTLTRCIRGIGIEIEDVILEPLASAEAVLTEDERQNGVMLADIGGGTTDIVVFKDNSVCFTAVLPVAGYQISRDISIGLGVPYDLAEEMKKKYADVTPVRHEVSARGKSSNSKPEDKIIAENGHNVSYSDMSEIIRIRVEELLRLIVLQTQQTDYAKFIPAGIVLTGGTANLPGIAELGSEVTHLPVRIGVPFDLYGVSDTLHDPAYATAVGLLLWKRRNESTRSWRPSNPVNRTMSGLFRFLS